MSWKYIVLSVGDQELPVIFPDRFVHAHVTRALQNMLIKEINTRMPPTMKLSKARKRILRNNLPAVSAGELTFEVTSVGGKSETLGLNSRPTDKALINSHAYTGGFK